MLGAVDASFASLTHSLRRDDGDYGVFFFSKAEDADAFCEQGCNKRTRGLDEKN